MNADPIRAYYQLRAAQTYFDKLPADLAPDQVRWLIATVDRQLAMENRVLGSPQAAGVQVPDQALRRAMEEVQAQYADSESFLDDLAALDLTVSQLGDLLERQLRVETVLEQQSARVAPASEADARGYYDANPAKFLQPERRQARHLLITVNPEYPENSPTAVTEKLDRIRAEVAADARLFEARARRHSECPTALQGGELGWVPRGHLYPQIDAALFALAVDAVSPVVETEVGMHLVQCTGIRPEERLAFEAVVDKIREKLTEVARQRAQAQWLRGLS